MSVDEEFEIDPAKLKKLSVDKLFFLVEDEKSPEIVWPCIAELQRRKETEVFERAMTFARSRKAKNIALGIDILAQLVSNDKKNPLNKHYEETVQLVLHYLRADKRARIIHSAAIAMSHLKDERAIEPLCKLADHENHNVRYGVAMGLGCHSDQKAVQILIKLTDDQDEEVRNWATFGLAQTLETLKEDDGLHKKISKTLLKCIEDPYEEVRMEAFSGLAKQKDQNIVQPLYNELMETLVSGYYPGTAHLQAVVDLREKIFYPLMQFLKDTDYYTGEYPEATLNEALKVLK